MRDEPLKTIGELADDAKKWFNETYPSEEACFEDVFSNGEYHEEEADWIGIASKLDDAELGSLFLPICKGLVNGVGGVSRDTTEFRSLMTCYTAIGKWQKRHLKDPQEILQPLAEVRELLFRAVLANQNAWWIEMLFQFQMLEGGILHRMGVWGQVTCEKYDALIYKLRK